MNNADCSVLFTTNIQLSHQWKHVNKSNPQKLLFWNVLHATTWKHVNKSNLVNKSDFINSSKTFILKCAACCNMKGLNHHLSLLHPYYTHLSILLPPSVFPGRRVWRQAPHCLAPPPRRPTTGWCRRERWRIWWRAAGPAPGCGGPCCCRLSSQHSETWCHPASLGSAEPPRLQQEETHRSGLGLCWCFSIMAAIQ